MTRSALGRAAMILMALSLFALEAVAFAGLARTVRGAVSGPADPHRSEIQVVSTALFQVALPAVSRALRGVVPAPSPRALRHERKAREIATCRHGAIPCLRIVTIHASHRSMFRSVEIRPRLARRAGQA